MTGRVALVGYPPRGFARGEAAAYLGVGVALFDAMVDDGRMPPPRRIAARRVWDRLELDAAFDRLPHAGDEDAPPAAPPRPHAARDDWDSILPGGRA